MTTTSAPTPIVHQGYLLATAAVSGGGPGRPDQFVPLRDERTVLQQAIGVWQRRKGSILLATSVVFVLAAAIALRIPDEFASSTSFLLEPVTGGADGAALDILNRVGRPSSAETEVQLIQSRRVLAPIVDSLGLAVELRGRLGRSERVTQLAAFQVVPPLLPGEYELRWHGGRLNVTGRVDRTLLASGSPGDTIRFNGISFAVPGRNAKRENLRLTVLGAGAALTKVRRLVHAERTSRESDIIQVTCTGGTPQKAQALCAAVDRMYLGLRQDLQRDQATGAARFLRDQAAAVGTRLALAEDSLMEYRAAAQAVSLDERATEQVRQDADLRAKRDQLSAEQQALKALVEKLDQRAGGAKAYRDLVGLPTFFSNQNVVVSRLVESLVDLENRRSELAVRRTERNAELTALDTRIGAIETQLQSIATTYAQGLSAQVAALDQVLSGSGRRLAALPAQQLQTARLSRQVQLLEDLFRFLQTRLREAEVAEAVNLPSVRIIDEASLPVRPSSPNLSVDLALGLLAAIGCGGLLGLLREYTDRSIRTRRELELGIGHPVLGMIPRMRRDSTRLLSAANGATGDRGNRNPSGSLSRWAVMEAFRGLGVELDFAAERLQRADIQVALVTSSSRGEGKTFTACNLAAVQATRGRRVLLIDADLRAAGATGSFGLRNRAQGLIQLLAGVTTLEDAVVPVAVSDGAVVYVLPTGNRSTATASTPDLSSIAKLLPQLRAQFHNIIIDSPPLNVLADAATLAVAADGVLVVARAGQTELENLELVCERLERAGGQVAGLVLNNVDLPASYTTYSYAGAGAA